jgi:hypothetical protein
MAVLGKNWELAGEKCGSALAQMLTLRDALDPDATTRGLIQNAYQDVGNVSAQIKALSSKGMSVFPNIENAKVAAWEVEGSLRNAYKPRQAAPKEIPVPATAGM